MFSTNFKIATFKNIKRTLWSSLSILAISGSLLSLPTMAQSPANSEPSAVLPPILQNSDPKINLKVASTVMENDKWTGKFDYSNNNEWERDVKCNTLYSRFNGMSGIVDYGDGISKGLVKNLMSPEFKQKVGQEYTFYENGMKTASNSVRDCNTQNIIAGNLKSGMSSGIGNPKNETDYRAFYDRPTGLEQLFTSANTPVFAYQYRYEIKFDAQNRTKMSKDYRPMTGTDGDYDGVVFAYTYYTYQKDGKWVSWENPNKDNKWGGWLIYGNKAIPQITCSNGMTGCGGGFCSYEMRDSLNCKGYSNPSTNITTNKSISGDGYNYATIKYNIDKKELSWQGKYSFNGSSCTKLINSSIKPINTPIRPDNLDYQQQYELVLEFKGCVVGQPVTADIGESEFSGSQILELSERTKSNFNSAFSYRESWNGESSQSFSSSQMIAQSSSTISTNQSSNSNSSTPNVFKKLTIGKKLDGKTDMIAEFQYAAAGNLIWTIDMIAYSGCDRVEDNIFLTNENGVLTLNLKNKDLGQMCTANVFEYQTRGNQDVTTNSGISPDFIRKSIETGNFVIKKISGDRSVNLYPEIQSQ